MTLRHNISSLESVLSSYADVCMSTYVLAGEHYEGDENILCCIQDLGYRPPTVRYMFHGALRYRHRNGRYRNNLVCKGACFALVVYSRDAVVLYCIT